MKYRCAVIKKEIHAYGLPVYLEKMLSLAAAAHALVFIKAVVAAGICKQVEFIQSLLFQIGKRGMKQPFCRCPFPDRMNGQQTEPIPPDRSFLQPRSNCSSISLTFWKI